MSEPTSGTDRWARIYEAMTGASAPPSSHDHDVDQPGAKPESLKAGHEPDRFDTKGIIFVPILVIIMAGIAYVVVTALFSHFEFGKLDTSKDVVQNQQAADEATKFYNDRIATISSTNPLAEVKEPRLEGLRNIDALRPGQDKPDPAYVRSFQATDKDHIQLVTPQDLYPDRYTDPITGKRLLVVYEFVNDKKSVARIPIAEAMKLVKVPAKKGSPNTSYGVAPKLSNGGQAVAALVTPKEPAPKPADKKEDPKH